MLYPVCVLDWLQGLHSGMNAIFAFFSACNEAIFLAHWKIILTLFIPSYLTSFTRLPSMWILMLSKMQTAHFLQHWMNPSEESKKVFLDHFGDWIYHRFHSGKNYQKQPKSFVIMEWNWSMIDKRLFLVERIPLLTFLITSCVLQKQSPPWL